MSQIFINEKQPTSKGYFYVCYNQDAIKYAAQDLSGDAFKAWCWFCSPTNWMTFRPYLNGRVAAEWGLDFEQFKPVLNELLTKGYLTEQGGNFGFVDMPKKNYDSAASITTPIVENNIDDEYEQFIKYYKEQKGIA